MRSSILLALSLLCTSPLAAAVPSPHVVAQSFEQHAHPLPLPYDEKSDAKAAVAKARAGAKAAHRLLLIDLGGNWCLDCRILAGAVELPDLKSFVRDHYELVTVDIGKLDKNLEIPARYGVTQLEGVPSLLVVDPVSNRLLNAGHIAALADARSMTPQGLADYLAAWAR